MNDFEELFNRQPPYSEDELKRVIAHFREARAKSASGVKPKKVQGTKADKIDLDGGLPSAKPEIEDIQL